MALPIACDPSYPICWGCAACSSSSEQHCDYCVTAQRIFNRLRRNQITICWPIHTQTFTVK